MFGKDVIKKAALGRGFDLCGIVRNRNFDAERRFFDEWLSRGYDGGLGYLSRNIDKRFSIEELMPGAKSVIVCAVNYRNGTGTDDDAAGGYPRIASYARAADYHVTVKDMLYGLAADLKDIYGDFSFRAFTDSAPILEKRLAVEAGLGHIGRNSLLISPEYGSLLLLGELVTDSEVDIYDEPYSTDMCGSCSLCVENCPNGALTSDGIDTRKCISRNTIEKDSEDIAHSLHGWIFGCDICQSVCPHNQSSPLYSNPLFAPVFDPREISVEEWLSMTEEEFDARFSATPLARTGLKRLQKMIKKQ